MEENKPDWEDVFDYSIVVDKFKRDDKGIIKFVVEKDERFKKLQDVSFDTAMPKEGLHNIIVGKYKTHWKNVLMLKDCQTLWIYQQLFFEVKPGTIFDFGTFTGGSALWAFDITRAMGLDTKIVTIDITHDNLDPIAAAQTEIKFIKGSAAEREINFPADDLKSYPKPWIILEDCHIETVKLWEYFDSFMSVGDYFVVEDLHPYQNYTIPDENFNYVTYEEHGSSKDDYLKEFLDKNPHWKIDTYYSNFFGNCASMNGFGYCCKIAEKA